MSYTVIRNEKYDYAGQSYASGGANLHKYPATMLPQIGIDILNEFGISSGKLLDPYCGSGSSFASGLECGIVEMTGFDLNPLAVLITKAKFTKVAIDDLVKAKHKLREQVYELAKDENGSQALPLPRITNVNFWFSKEVRNNLNIVRYFVNQIEDENIRRLFWVPFSETVRDCSYTRNGEFKMYRMKSEELLKFNPDVFGVYFSKLNNVIDIYANTYFPRLSDAVKVDVRSSQFKPERNTYDVVLTSPPYGDSRTTVAYGQFSALSNEWLGIDYARKIDRMLMGGAKATTNITTGLIADVVARVSKEDHARALDVSSFYRDLGRSIACVARSVKRGGKAIYIVGNRTVKKVQLPTDQFIAEKFEENGFKHLVTYERLLGNKSMPSKNSPTNQVGKTVNTMLYEYIVVCEKTHRSGYRSLPNADRVSLLF